MFDRFSKSNVLGNSIPVNLRSLPKKSFNTKILALLFELLNNEDDYPSKKRLLLRLRSIDRIPE